MGLCQVQTDVLCVGKIIVARFLDKSWSRQKLALIHGKSAWPKLKLLGSENEVLIWNSFDATVFLNILFLLEYLVHIIDIIGCWGS